MAAVSEKRERMNPDKKDKKTEGSGPHPEKKMNRRDFIQGLSTVPVLGAFAVSLAGKLIHEKPAAGSVPKKIPGDLSDIHVAFLGTGSQGQVLLNACLKIPGLRFKAVCDIWTSYNQTRAARILKKYNHDVNTYENYLEMLSSEKDLDADHTAACLEAGLHVYCEKEMSNTLEGARKMVKATRKTGKLLQIGHQRRSNPRYLHCYNHLIQDANLLGRITSVNGQWNRAVQPDLGWPDKYAIDLETLRKYGFQSMQQFCNWRWY
jgi:hypothetical protein